MEKAVATNRTAVILLLLFGDLLVFFLFAFFGRVAHGLSLNFLSIATTASPFVLSWLILGSLFGIFKQQAYSSVKQAAKKTAATWLIVGLIALIIRSIIVGTGFVAAFYVITLVTILLLLLLWRMACAYFFLGNSK